MTTVPRFYAVTLKPLGSRLTQAGINKQVGLFSTGTILYSHRRETETTASGRYLADRC
jgi:hypothetical protein